jgi:hypothetical protein
MKEINVFELLKKSLKIKVNKFVDTLPYLNITKNEWDRLTEKLKKKYNSLADLFYKYPTVLQAKLINICGVADNYIEAVALFLIKLNKYFVTKEELAEAMWTVIYSKRQYDLAFEIAIKNIEEREKEVGYG